MPRRRLPPPATTVPSADPAAPLAPGPSPTRFAVVDVETSGLRPTATGSCRSASCAVLGDGTVVDRWDTLLRAPWRPLGGRDIHGLSRRTLRGAPRLARSPPAGPALDGTIVCAHNAEFDWPFLRGLAPGRLRRRTLRLCTLRLSRSLDPDAHAPPPGRPVPALRHPPHPAPTTPRPTPTPPPRPAPPPRRGRRSPTARSSGRTSPAPRRPGRRGPVSGSGPAPVPRPRGPTSASSGGSSTSADGPSRSSSRSSQRSTARAARPPGRPPSGVALADRVALGHPGRRRACMRSRATTGVGELASQSGASGPTAGRSAPARRSRARASMRSTRNQRSLAHGVGRPPAGTSGPVADDGQRIDDALGPLAAVGRRSR